MQTQLDLVIKEKLRLQTRIVPPDGPLDAEICFIGEAPGDDEDRSLHPFSGPAGQLFNRWLRQAGILRINVLVNNVFSQRPPNNKVDYFFLDSRNTRLTWEGESHVESLRLWLEKLLQKRQRGASGPNLLVALGKIPLQILTGKRRINKWRGSLLPCTLVPGFIVYPTYHPSHINRMLSERRESLPDEYKRDLENILPVFIEDLQRIQEQSKRRTIPLLKRDFDINLPFGELIARINHMTNSENCLTVAVDIETLLDPKGPILWCIGFSIDPSYAFVVPFIRKGRIAWSVEEEAELLRTISCFFLSRHIKVFHNGTYDLSILGKYYGLRCAPGTYQDTMWLHHAVHPYLRKSLELLTSIYTWEPYYKDEGKVHSGLRSSDEAEFLYNAKDCSVTRELFPILRRQASDQLITAGYQRSMSLMPSILGMMLRGVRIDLEKKEQLGKEFELRAVQAQEQARKYTKRDWNLASYKQKQELLYIEKNLKVQVDHRTGKVTTDKDALINLKKLYPDEPIIKCILDFQKYSKLASTYTSMNTSEDGRVYTSYGFVSTWRLSSSESPFGVGGNLQNIPSRGEEARLIRDLFIPDKGREFLSADLSQAEARCVSWEAEDIKRIESFNEGRDVHWEAACEIFDIGVNIPYEPDQTYLDSMSTQEFRFKQLREVAKTVVHASNYGLGPIMLQKILTRVGFPFSAPMCKQLLDKRHQRNPFTLQWQRGIREKIRASRTLVTPLGRKRQFLGRLDDQLFRAAYAFSPQSTVGELLCLGLKAIWDTLPQVEILLNIHDEVLMQIKPELIEDYKPEIKKLLEIPLEIEGRSLVIPVEFKRGFSWGSLKPC